MKVIKRTFTVANVLIFLFLLAPILIVIPVSFSATQYVVFPPQGFSLKWYANFFQTKELVASLLVSVRLAVFTTAIGTAVGTLVAVALVRYRFFGRNLLRTFFLSPMVVPGLVLGIAMLMFFSRTILRGSFTAILFAHVVVVLPYVVRTVTSSLIGVDQILEQAAMSLGASPVVAFRTVTLPLLKSGIVAGGILAFVTSFDELVISLFLTGPRLSTLPVQIYNYIEYTSDPTIAAISVILIFFSTAVVLITERLLGFSQYV